MISPPVATISALVPIAGRRTCTSPHPLVVMTCVLVAVAWSVRQVTSDRGENDLSADGGRPSTGTVDCAVVPIVAARGGDDLCERGSRFVSPASRMRRDGGRLRVGAGRRCVGAE